MIERNVSLPVREADANRFLDAEAKDEQSMFNEGKATVDEMRAMEGAVQAEATRIRDGDVSLTVAEEEIDDMVSHAMQEVDDAKNAFEDDDDEDCCGCGGCDQYHVNGN